MRTYHWITTLAFFTCVSAFSDETVPSLSSFLQNDAVSSAPRVLQQKTVLFENATLRLPEETVTRLAPTFSLTSPEGVLSTLKIEGPGDLINESVSGLCPEGLIIASGTVANHKDAVIGADAGLFRIVGGTLINGDPTTNGSAFAGARAALIDVCGGTIVNDSSQFGLSASEIKIQSGTVINRNGSYFGTSVAKINILGGTVINDHAHFGHHVDGRLMKLTVSGGTVINQNSAIIGSSHTHVVLKSGIVINSKDSQILSSTFDMQGGQLINDGTVVIDNPDGSAFTPGGIITGTGYFKSRNPHGPFTLRNEHTMIPGTFTPQEEPDTTVQPVALFEEIAKTLDIDHFVAEMIEHNSYGQIEEAPIPFTPGPITLDQGGTYQQAPTGTLVINIVDENSHGQIVAPSAEIDGTLLINPLANFNVEPGKPLTIISAPQGVTGAFAHIETPNLPSLLPTIRYLQGSITVTFSPTISSYIGDMPQTLFASVNHLNTRLNRQMKGVRSRFSKEQAPLPTESAYEPSKRIPIANLMADNHEPMLLSLMKKHMVAIEDSPADEETTPTPASAPVEAPAQTHAHAQDLSIRPNRDHPWNLYIGPIGSLGNVDCFSHQRGFDYWSAGALSGFDYAFSQVGFGIATMYERIDASVHEGWGDFTIDQAEASLYGTYAPSQLPEFAVNGIVGGGYEWYNIRRHTGTTLSPKTAKGTPHGHEFNALVGFEYLFAKEQFTWIPKSLQFLPMANLQYIYVHVNSYKERGAGLYDMKVNAQKAKSLRSFLGGQLSYLWDWTDFAFSFAIDAGWQREYLNKTTSVSFAPLRVAGPTSSLSVFGAGRNTVLAGADLLFTLYRQFQINASYDYEWNSRFQDHFFYLGFNYRF